MTRAATELASWCVDTVMAINRFGQWMWLILGGTFSLTMAAFSVMAACEGERVPRPAVRMAPAAETPAP